MRDCRGGLSAVDLDLCLVDVGLRERGFKALAEEMDEAEELRERFAMLWARLGSAVVEGLGKEGGVEVGGVGVGVEESTKREVRSAELEGSVLGVDKGGERLDGVAVARVCDIFVVVVLCDGMRFNRRSVMTFASAGERGGGGPFECGPGD